MELFYDILFLYYASFDLAEDNTATVDLEDVP